MHEPLVFEKFSFQMEFLQNPTAPKIPKSMTEKANTARLIVILDNCSLETVKLGKGKEGFILGACRQGICFIPVILIFPFIWGLNGILYAQPIADVLSALITVFMAIPLHRSLAVAEQKMKITASIPCDRQ